MHMMGGHGASVYRSVATAVVLKSVLSRIKITFEAHTCIMKTSVG